MLNKEIIEKHGGNIWFYSEINKGSEFHFTLPRSENTILIIEEHEELQNNYKNLISDKFSSYKIKFSKNGSDATDAAVKLARAYTGRDLIAICADHPFFSVSDWFIGIHSRYRTGFDQPAAPNANRVADVSDQESVTNVR